MNCPVCNNNRYKELFTDKNRRGDADCVGTYVLCLQCDLIYLIDAPNNVLYNKEITVAVKPVPGWKKLLRPFRFRPHSWPLESQIEAIHYMAKNILDIGCGSGKKLLEFYERGYKVCGIDINEKAIESCRKLMPNGSFACDELQNIRLIKFDYIRIDNALEHMPNPTDVIEKCKRLLKDNGKLLIYVPHGKSLSMRWLKGGSISSWIPFHLQLFTRKSLKRLLDDAGLKSKVFGYCPRSWLPLSFAQANIVCPKPILYIIGWIACKIGLSEELIAIAEKRNETK